MREVPAVAADQIARMRADGVVVDDDDVVWLASLGRRVEHPTGQTPEAAGIRHGITMSDGTTLHPQTVGGSMWLDRFGGLFGNAESLFAVAFVLCHSVPELRMLNQSSAVVDAVNEWKAGLAVSVDELATALDRVLATDAPPPTPQESEREPEDPESTIARLVAVTGLPFDYWEEQTWARALAADSGAFKWAMMLSPFGGSQKQSESREALRDLLRAVVSIRNRGSDNG